MWFFYVSYCAYVVKILIGINRPIMVKVVVYVFERRVVKCGMILPLLL
jgi:hypothetical protein